MNVRYPRRLVLAFVAASAFAPKLPLAQPVKPVRLIVPFPAGGTADVLPRIVAESMRSAFPNGIVVENKAGAGGNIGAADVARADADGTTYLVSPPGPIAINHHLFKRLQFDPAKWVPVTVLATVPNVLAVRKSFPASNLQEFVAYVRANPGRVSYASQGNGSTSHLTAGLFMQLTGTDMIHVPTRALRRPWSISWAATWTSSSITSAPLRSFTRMARLRCWRWPTSSARRRCRRCLHSASRS